MKSLKSIRPSNLVLLAAAPFFVYLFVYSNKYHRSLKVIIGIEDGALSQLTGFVLLVVLAAAGFFCTRFRPKIRTRDGWFDRLSPLAALAVPLMLALLIARPDLALPFVHSAVVNSVDAFTSPWIVPDVQPRQLTNEIQEAVARLFRTGLIAYGLLFLAFVGANWVLKAGFAPYLARSLEIVSAAGFLYFVFVAHWGFGSGIAVTLRAAIFAYAFAAVLGMVWTSLQSFRQKPYTIRIYAGLSLALLAFAAYYAAQPYVRYVLAGTTQDRVAIVRGTPQSMAEMIRFGEYPGAESKAVLIRSAQDVETAIRLVRENEQVSGAFIPKQDSPADLPVIFEISFLPDKAKVPAFAFTALAVLLSVLTFGAWQHGRHPLAIASEFIVDTIRGIPMLVIILYIGLPLSGVVKQATGGGIDLSNLARGIVAISIGYSAYLAEIFRSGIESVPKGQIEAGLSLGLSRWQTARLIVLPQALLVVIPPLGNEFIAIIKDTSLLSILSVRDITQRMREFQASSFLTFAPFNTAAILYIVITLACASLFKWVERRNDYKRGH